jgi:hypothetical protein
MTERTYPYTGWTITPAGRPKKHTFVEKAKYGDRQRNDASSLICLDLISPTKQDAISAALAAAVAAQSRLDKQQANLNKRIAELKKWEFTI